MDTGFIMLCEAKLAKLVEVVKLKSLGAASILTEAKKQLAYKIKICVFCYRI